MDNHNKQHRQRLDKIGKLKKEFDVIKLCNGEISNVFDNIDTKLRKLKEMYKSFMNDSQNTLFVFGLDSFKFQNRLIDEDYATLKKYYNLICNGIYRDYYKLFLLICDFIVKDDTLKKIHRMVDKNKYPKYDYLDVYKMYDIQSSSDIFNEIISLINALNDQSKSVSTQIQTYNNKKKFGLNINNFIYTHSYKNSMLNEQIYLYLNYISFFIKLHMKYFTRYVNKIRLMYNEISSDINFDNTDDNKEKEPITLMSPMSRLSSEFSNNPSPIFSEESDSSDKESVVLYKEENIKLDAPKVTFKEKPQVKVMPKKEEAHKDEEPEPKKEETHKEEPKEEAHKEEPKEQEPSKEQEPKKEDDDLDRIVNEINNINNSNNKKKRNRNRKKNRR